MYVMKRIVVTILNNKNTSHHSNASHNKITMLRIMIIYDNASHILLITNNASNAFNSIFI